MSSLCTHKFIHRAFVRCGITQIPGRAISDLRKDSIVLR